jgi:hypothetical protein
MPGGTRRTLYSVWGSGPRDVFASGDFGEVIHYNGREWERLESGVSVHLRSIMGLSGFDVYAVGSNGTIIHYTPR